MSQVLNFTHQFSKLTRKEQLLYVAGLFDGEGCIGLYNCRSKAERRAAHYQLVVRLRQKTPYGVKALLTLWPDGNFSMLKNVGENRPGPYFDFRLTNRKAEVMLKEIIPFLREKHSQANMALEFCELRRAQNVVSKREQRKMTATELDVRDAYLEKIKAEKQRSFDITYIQGEH